MAYDMLVIAGTPVLRAVAGWLENALADGKIEMFEWKRLLGTVLRLGVPALALYYGFELDPEFAAAIPLVADYVLNMFVKYAKKEKEV